MTLIVNISKVTGLPKNIVWGFISAVILGIGSFVWMNVTLPKEKKDTDDIKVDIKYLKRSDSAKSIQFEIMKYDVKTVINSQEDLKEDIHEIKEGQKDLARLVIEVLRQKSIGLVNK